MSCYEDFQTDESEIPLGDGKPEDRVPNGTARVYRVLWADHTLLVPQSAPTN